MRDFVAPKWRAIFRDNGLEVFERFWELESEWFEEPNRRRGGWSGVMRVPLKLPQGDETWIFLKKQESHSRRTLLHPLTGEPTFRAEARNLLFLNEQGVAAPELVYYAERRSAAGRRVVLATRELKGFEPLDLVIQRWRKEGWKGHEDERRRLIVSTARLLRKLHDLHRVHKAMHPKHLFVRPESGEVCLIDLEKMRYRPLRRQAMLRDLDSLNRRTRHVSRSDRLRFLLAYLGRDKVDDGVRRAWHRLARKRRSKR